MTFDGIDDFRRRLAAGETLLGTGISFSDVQSSEALADRVDFLWVDLEHSTMSAEALRGHLAVARGRRRALHVRLPGSATHIIKPVLDAGAAAIVVPQVRSVDEVRAVIADCRYPPVGCRGFGNYVASDYGRIGDDYVERANRSLFVSVMIECAEAVEAIGEIVALPGLDSVVLGPYDLSGSLGVLGQVHHADVVAAMERVLAAAAAVNLPVGSGMPADPDFAPLQAPRGVRWLQMGGDLDQMVRAVNDTVGTVRARLAG
jgi:2-keto-3-deoxy-L-rhamnonate aldolase RhmA